MTSKMFAMLPGNQCLPRLRHAFARQSPSETALALRRKFVPLYVASIPVLVYDIASIPVLVYDNPALASDKKLKGLPLESWPLGGWNA